MYGSIPMYFRHFLTQRKGSSVSRRQQVSQVGNDDIGAVVTHLFRADVARHSHDEPEAASFSGLYSRQRIFDHHRPRRSRIHSSGGFKICIGFRFAGQLQFHRDVSVDFGIEGIDYFRRLQCPLCIGTRDDDRCTDDLTLQAVQQAHRLEKNQDRRCPCDLPCCCSFCATSHHSNAQLAPAVQPASTSVGQWTPR